MMQKNTLTVVLETEAGELVEETVDARLCDQVRAEHELRKRYQMGPTEAGITFVSAMAWAALAREKRTELRFDAFLAAAHEVSRVKPEDAGDVDPTRQAASNGSASPSPAPTPEPATTGGTPA